MNSSIPKAGYTASLRVVDLSNNVLTSASIPANDNCTWTQGTLVAGAFAGRRVKLQFFLDSTAADGSTLTTTDSYILGGDITFYYNVNSAGSSYEWDIDNVANGSSTITTGYFLSRVIDTAFQYSLVAASATWVVDDITPTFAVYTSSASTGPWSAVLTSTGSEAAIRRYIQYSTTFTVTGGDAVSTLDSVAFVARSSGSYYSSVSNAPNITSWDTFTENSVLNGGALSYFVRSSTNTFSIQSSTPSWVSQPSGGVVAASTGTYFQVRADFSVSSTTQTPTLNDFTLNWFEGTAGDKAYATWFNDAIWWSVAFGDGQSTNNYIFRYDLLQPGWTLYNFGTGGFLRQNNNLYFGTTAATGKLYRFGGSTADEGSAINAYWKSKDFAGPDPWIENEFLNLDTLVTRDPNQSLTASYSLNASTTTTSFAISLSSSTNNVIRSKKPLPNGKIGGLINVQYGDTSATSEWELLGFRLNLNPLTYNPNQ